MQTFFTHTPRPQQPPGRTLLSLLPLLFFLLLPALASAQNCFSGLNAGDNASYCEGETATLDGGYDFYDETGDPDTGTPVLTWSIQSGSGTFFVGGVMQPDGSTAIGTNFNNSENGITGFPDVTFVPDAGVFVVTLRLSATTTGNTGTCDGPQVEDLTLYFDPAQATPIDATLEGTMLLDDATTGTIDASTGDVLTLVIDESNIIDNSVLNDDIQHYEVTYSGPGGFIGLPPAGVYTQNEFATHFFEKTLTSMICGEGTITLEVFAFYDRNNDDLYSGADECPGELTTITINVAPRPEPVATIGVADTESAVCEDDENVQIVVTGTPFTTVTYNVSYDGGATNAIEGATLELDATGVSFDIVVDATLADSDDDIIVTLTQIEYTDGPACQKTISKPVVIDVFPLPTLMLELVHPEDALLCNQANGGPSSIQYRVLTSSGDGVYSFTVTDLVDGVEIKDVTFNNETFTNGVGPTLNFIMSGAFESSQLITLMVDGASVTREDLIISCTNDSPDASITWVVQPELFATVNVEVNEDGEQVLDDDSVDDTLEVSVCDEGNLSIDLDDLPVGFMAAAGTSAQLEVTVDNPDNVPGVPTSGIFDFDTNTFSFDGPLDIPNSQTISSEITFTFTPFFEDNGSAGFDGDECSGTPLTLIVEILPAPTVDIAVSDPLICAGDDVTVTITASEPGTATLFIGQGGAGTPYTLVDDGFGGGILEILFEDITEETMFSVNTFVGDVAGCSAILNLWALTEVEENPDATVSAHPETICDDGTTTVTFTGSGGNGEGFVFTYSLNYGTDVEIPSGDDDLTATLELDSDDLNTGENTLTLVSVANQLNDAEEGLACSTVIDQTITIGLEDVPAVVCNDEDDEICSGDEYSISFTADSPDPSAIGSELYYQIVVTDNTSGSPAVTTTYELASDDPTVGGTAVNMTGFDQDIVIVATPFYFAGDDPDADDFADACQGESCSVTLTVYTMPMATFGGNDAICDGDDGVLIFTGPPNGTVNLAQVDEEGNVIEDFGIYSFDGGGTTVLFAENFTQDFIIQLSEVTDVNGCTGDMTFEFAVDVTPRPTAAFDPDTDGTTCEGSDQEITLSGTPFALVTIDSDLKDANDQVVVLDENGEGSFTVTGDEDETFTITDVTITAEDGNGTDFTCSATYGEIAALAPFELTVDPAPTGALVTNAILCAGDEPQLQFNATTGDGFEGTYDISVLNDITGDVYDFTVSNGEELVFDPAITLDVTTGFSLTFIQRNSLYGSLECDNLVEGVGATVVVNEVPEVDVDGIPTGVICSGDEVLLTATGSPMMSEDGNPLFYEVVFTDGVGAPGTEQVLRVPADANSDLNELLGLPDDFVNPSTTVNDVIAFTVQPYYEAVPGDPQGPDVMDQTIEDFTGYYDGGNWTVVDETWSSGVFSPDGTSLTLTSGDDNQPAFSGNDDVVVSIEVEEMSLVSFNAAYVIENIGFADVAIINFEGVATYRTRFRPNFTVQTGNQDISEVIAAGSQLSFALIGDGSSPFNIESTLTITEFEVDPIAQPCPGAIVEVEFEVLPALFADFSSAPTRVCEGDDAEICIAGTPDATVTVFFNGIYNDVKLDAEGNGCFTTVGGLTVDTDFLILGLTTLEDMPQCSFTFEDGLWPVAPVMVIPTPFATIELEPTTFCAGEEDISAAVTGTPNATVTYTYNNVADVVELDAHGDGTIPVSTTNNGTADIICHIILTSITVDVEGVICTAPLTDESVTVTVRPLPNGTISAGPAVCAGEQVTLFFTADPDLLGDYSIIVLDPNGAELTLSGTSGGSFLDTDIAGTYTLISITDGTGTEIGCTRTGEDLGTAEIIIEEVPTLTAAVTGTAGTANLNSESHIFNVFPALVCDEGTIDVVFGSSTEDAQAMGELMINVQVDANDEDQVNVGPVGTTVITFDELNSGDFLDGILSNLADAGVTSVDVVLTPFFENGADAGALEATDCAGGTLSFFIDILPAVQFDVDKGNSSLTVCEGDDINIELTGSPGAEVMFTTTGFTLTGDSEGGVLVLEDGTATITGIAGGFGEATVTVDMVMLTTIEGNISRQCMLMDQGVTTILINEVPDAILVLDDEGPICNGETVEVSATLINTNFENGDIFVFVVDGETYTVPLNGHGTAFLFTSEELTENTSFLLTSVTNDDTGCSVSAAPAVSVASVMVEEIPTGEVVVTSDGVETTVSGGTPGTFEICANERVDLAVLDTNDDMPLVGKDYVEVVFSISEDIDFYGLGQTGTIALDFMEFATQFSREYNMISGSPVTIDLAITYYNETDHEWVNSTLEPGECSGITDYITIVINPNPKTADDTDMVCSGEALDYDLDDAIVNGVVGATFSYTVASDDVDVSGLDRTVASDANVTDEFENFSTGDYTVIYTVTPFGTDGAEDCQGNDFELVVTVKPEPVITDDLTVEVCSGAPTACVVELSNVGDNLQALLESSTFELTDIAYSLEGPGFIPAAHNKVIGDEGDYQFIAYDVFTNLSSEPQTVTYTIVPTSVDGCVGEPNTIVVTVLPEAVVANMVVKVCSGGSIDLGFDELTANGVGNVLSFVRTAGPAVTLLRIFDENGDDVTGESWFGGSSSNSGITSINDSYLNTGTGTLSVFYNVEIQVTGETGDEGGPLTCPASTFTLEVQVVEEADVVLEPIAGQTAICAGEPITLVATYDGSGNEQTFEYSYVSADGVVLELTPSAAGGEVSVDAVSGMGNATVMVMVTDDNSCLAMATRTVSVGTSPEVMEISGDDDPCIGDYSFFHIEPTPGSTYLWSLSHPGAGTFTNHPATGSNTSIIFNSTQGFGPFHVMVTETSAAGCTTTSSLTVNLYEETVADFVAEEDPSDPLTFNFTELAGGSVEYYSWDFGDGSDPSYEQSPTHTYVQADPGAQHSYTVTLTVLGCSGIVTASKVIVTNSTAEEDIVELQRGVNFISFDVAPADNSIRVVFANMPDLVRVVTVDGSVPTSFQPELPNFRNSLSTIEPGFGYVVIMDEAATMTVTGEPVDDAFLRPTGMGINYVACVPEGPTPAATAWSPYTSDGTLNFARTFGNNLFSATGDFVQTFTPGLAPFRQSMHDVFNGHGYMIIRSDVASAQAPDASSSEEYEFVHGKVEGVDFTAGDDVDILNEAGDVIGRIATDETGNFRSTAIFGKVERQDGTLVGSLEEGEEVAFRYHGQVIKPGLYYHGGFNGTGVDLNFTEVTSTEVTDLALNVMPNPAVDHTTITLELSEDAEITIRAMDATGRIVRELMPRQQLSAGTTNVEWTNMNTLPAGLYHVVVLYEGQLLPELTKRVVKQ